MRRFTSVFLLLCTFLSAFISSAQQTLTTTVPNLVRYGGTLKDAQGAPIAPGTTGVTFAIYKQEDGGAPVWMETQSVTPDAGGNYSVLLGSTTGAGLPSDLFSQQEQRWLGVQVQGGAEEPRVLLVSVPYAFKAHEAETLGGKSISDFVLASGARSSVTGDNTGRSSVPGVNVVSASSGSRNGAASNGPTNFSGSTTDQIVGVTQSGSGVGLNAAAPSKAIVGTSTASSGTAVGVEGGASSTTGYGVYGNTTSSTGLTVGVKGNSLSTTGTGVRGTNTATSGSTVGISSYVASLAGIAAVFNNAAGGKIISGLNNGAEKFSVDGNGNVNSTSGTYQVGGTNILGTSNVAGTPNLFVGLQAGSSNTTGYGDTFVGTQAGYANSGGVFNVFSGYFAGLDNTTGNDNVLIGVQAGENNSTASGGTFVGTDAGQKNTTGSNNTFLGFLAGPDSAHGTLTNATAIGANAVVAESNALILGGTGSNAVQVGIGTTAPYPGVQLDVRGGALYVSSPSFTPSNPEVFDAENHQNEVDIYAARLNFAANTDLQLWTGTSGAALPVMRLTSSGYVGIDTTTPTSALDTVGTLTLEGSGHGIIFPDGTMQTTAATGGGVTSWNARTGAVVPQTGDYNFSQVSQTLGSSQLAGTYNQAVTLSNTSNVLYGDGSHLTGVVVQTTAGCISEAGSPPGCPCNGKLEQCIGISNGGFCQVTSQTGGCSASAPNNSYGSCTVCRPN